MHNALHLPRFHATATKADNMTGDEYILIILNLVWGISSIFSAT